MDKSYCILFFILEYHGRISIFFKRESYLNDVTLGPVGKSKVKRLQPFLLVPLYIRIILNFAIRFILGVLNNIISMIYVMNKKMMHVLGLIITM